MEYARSMARRHVKMAIISGISPAVLVAIGLILGILLIAGVVASSPISAGSSPGGTGVSGALPITSPQFQAVLNDPAGTVVMLYPGNNIPPSSLVPYALPGITVPATGYPQSPTYGNGIPGQCTYWAELNWIPPNSANARLIGNADQLVASAESQGIQPVNIPAPGELVVWGPGSIYDPYVGHVAVVVGVNATNRTFVVEEMNYTSGWSIDYRVVSDSAGDVLGFIPSGLTLAAPTPGPGAAPTP